MRSPSVSQSHAAPGSGAETLRFVHPTPPAPGHTIEIAPGILWARLALPFLLDHVNIYFVDDGKGWALIDTGVGDGYVGRRDPLLGTVLRDRPLTRIIATHFTPIMSARQASCSRGSACRSTCRPLNICSA